MAVDSRTGSQCWRGEKKKWGRMVAPGGSGSVGAGRRWPVSQGGGGVVRGTPGRARGAGWTGKGWIREARKRRREPALCAEEWSPGQTRGWVEEFAHKGELVTRRAEHRGVKACGVWIAVESRRCRMSGELRGLPEWGRGCGR